MRSLIRVFCGLLALGLVANALPADRSAIESVELDKDPNAESEEFPVRPLIPLDGFLSGFNEMFERLRQQMLHLMSQVPIVGGPPGQGGNTTSVTKVINGHKVIINETVYASPDGEDAAAVFKVRVVDIRPDFSENTSDDFEEPKESAESVDESHENEIPKSLRKTSHAQKRKINKKDFYNSNALHEFKNLENFDYPTSNNLESFDALDSSALDSFDNFGDNIPIESKPNLETFDEESLGNSIESMEEEDKAIVYKNKNKIDLSRDIYVNKIAEMQNKPHNPDAEILEFQPARPLDLSRDTYVNEIAARRNYPLNPDAEMIDNIKFERIVPFGDLSRDTYVNEIAARRRMPLNPDAEFMDMVPKNSRYFYRTHHQDS